PEPASILECRLASTQAPAPYTTLFRSSYSSLADGLHTFEVRATDPAGNADPTPDSRSFTVDTAPPNTTITGGPSGATKNPSPTFARSSTRPNSSHDHSLDATPDSD